MLNLTTNQIIGCFSIEMFIQCNILSTNVLYRNICNSVLLKNMFCHFFFKVSDTTRNYRLCVIVDPYNLYT